MRLGFVPGAMTKVPAVPCDIDAPVQNCELYNISEVEDLRSLKMLLFGSFKFFALLSFQLFARVDLHPVCKIEKRDGYSVWNYLK